MGRFVILSPLGGGGMGTVYAAFDPALDRRVAVKLLHVQGPSGDDSESRARLLREAKAMARIVHPNVVTVFDVGVTGDQDQDVFLAMEMVDGGTVHDWLDARPRSWRETLRLFCEAGEGLAAAHRAGIIHRDFKLDNVVIGKDGKPRVTDFGLARAASPEDPARPPDSSALPLARGGALSSPSGSLNNPLTETGEFLGTPGYMAPEQYGVSDGIDARADVFAFCAALYRALYGERAFVGETVDQIAFSTLNGRIRDARPGSDVPPWLRRALLRGLAVDRDRRFASMEELLAALRDDPRRRWARWLAWTAGVLATAGALAAWRVRARPAAPACPVDATAFAGVWDAPRKQAVRQAFVATGRSYAADTWKTVEHDLDDYTTRWQAARKDACEATRVRGEQSQAMFELRTECLDDRREELRALVDVLATADGASVAKAVEAASGLSPIDSCADVDRLSAGTRLPVDPKARATIVQLGNDIVAAKALAAAGRRLAAIDRLRAVRARVDETGYGPLLFAWTYRLALSEERIDQNAAVADYERAIALAEANRLDPEKAQAEIDLASLEGGWLGRSADSHRWMDLARATIARLGGDARLEASSDVEEGWVYYYEHKIGESGRLFGRVLGRRDFDGLPAPMRASASSGMGEVLGAQGKNDEAVQQDEHALGVMEATLGRQHPQLVGYINNLAVAQLEAGRVDDALASASRALGMLEDQVRRGDIAPSSPDLGLAAQTMGEVLQRANRPADAVAQLLRACASYRASQGEDNADVAFADNELAEALRETKRTDEAKRALDEASAIEKKTSDVPPAVVAGTLAGLARLQLDEGRAASALPLAKRAFDALGDDGTPHERADVRLVLADALRATRADPAQSRALAEKARGLFATAHDEDRVHACDVMLASLR